MFHSYILFAGEEFSLKRDLKVRAFKTYHVIDSQVTYLMHIYFDDLVLFLCPKFTANSYSITLAGLFTVLCKTEA